MAADVQGLLLLLLLLPLRILMTIITSATSMITTTMIVTIKTIMFWFGESNFNGSFRSRVNWAGS